MPWRGKNRCFLLDISRYTLYKGCRGPKEGITDLEGAPGSYGEQQFSRMDRMYDCAFRSLFRKLVQGGGKMKTTRLVHASLVILVASSTCLAGLADGLVAYYPFNGNADDASGNGHHGGIFGALLTSGSPKCGPT